VIVRARVAIACFALVTEVCASDGTIETDSWIKTRTVMTSSGPVVGAHRENLDWFLGIPYAAPPVGELRWRPPAAPKEWSLPRKVTAFGNWCTQVAPEGFSKPVINEDCLYLNVVTPHDTSRHKSKRAVMVWIHGGGLRQGRSNDYDPTLLVEKGVVFVSFNYRLNIFGFLTHPDLDHEGHSFANYGLMDQQFAFAWVRRNIKAFGGDPDNVTLIGESSGGANVFNHLVSPKSAGLFNKAIVESASLWFGDFAPFYNGLSVDDAEAIGRSAAKLMGCPEGSGTACMRSASAEMVASVIKQLPTYAFGVVLEGTIITEQTRDAIVAGRFKRVPIINGTNHDEWTWVEGLRENAAGHPLNEGEMKARLKETFGDAAEKIAPHYPVSAFDGSAGAAVARAVTDGLFVCPLLGANRTLANFTNVWGYEFNDTNAPYPFRSASFPYGAAHTLEMRYIFKDYIGAVGNLRPLSPYQRALSSDMVSYWTNFAKTGNPNSKDVVDWPVIKPGAEWYLDLVSPRPTLSLSDGIAVTHQCQSTWRARE
jgi:para-nitrobenzyl esterase